MNGPSCSRAAAGEMVRKRKRSMEKENLHYEEKNEAVKMKLKLIEIEIYKTTLEALMLEQKLGLPPSKYTADIIRGRTPTVQSETRKLISYSDTEDESG